MRSSDCSDRPEMHLCTKRFLLILSQVRRKEPLDSKFTQDVRANGELLTSDSMKRSIYAKGFGEETGSTGFDIEE